MLLYKPRTKPQDLMILEFLNNRMNLSKEDKQYYYNLLKGFEGENLFDSYTEKLTSDCLVLNDLLLEVNNTTFQIDSLIITKGTIYIFEVKYFEGDYYYESDKLFKKPKLEVINPLHQLGRNESLLRQLLLKLGFQTSIHASVVFMNPTFTLYQAPLDKPFIFPTQIKSYLSKLNSITSKLTDRDIKLAEQLLSLRLIDSSYSKIPKYEYKDLQKGITCHKCQSFFRTIQKRLFVCDSCKFQEPVRDAILRSIKEFQILFPNEKLTTRIIHDWCKIIPVESQIRRILLKHYTRVGDHRWSYYIKSPFS